jgi:hypothetical protein
MSTYFSTSDMLHLPVTIGADQPGDSVKSMVNGGAGLSAVEILAKPDRTIKLSTGEDVPWPWGEESDADEESVRKLMEHERGAEKRLAEKRRIEEERLAEEERLVRAEHLIGWGVSTKFCPEDCENSGCKYLHHYHRNMIICHDHE